MNYSMRQPAAKKIVIVCYRILLACDKKAHFEVDGKNDLTDCTVKPYMVTILCLILDFVIRHGNTFLLILATSEILKKREKIQRNN